MTSVQGAELEQAPAKPAPSMNFVPHTEVTVDSAPGRSTASPCVDAVTVIFGLLLKSQSAGPLSPAGPSTVIPSALACCISAFSELSSVGKKFASQLP